MLVRGKTNSHPSSSNFYNLSLILIIQGLKICLAGRRWRRLTDSFRLKISRPCNVCCTVCDSHLAMKESPSRRGSRREKKKRRSLYIDLCMNQMRSGISTDPISALHEMMSPYGLIPMILFKRTDSQANLFLLSSLNFSCAVIPIINMSYILPLPSNNRWVLRRFKRNCGAQSSFGSVLLQSIYIDFFLCFHPFWLQVNFLSQAILPQPIVAQGNFNSNPRSQCRFKRRKNLSLFRRSKLEYH